MAVTQSITKKFIPTFKDVNYLSKNFSDFRQNLIEFAKAYYPNTYSDFNEASPGMMFIEMAAYVGDVMSFYIDNQFKENLMVYARERKNVVSIAQAFGYRPRIASPSTVTATIYQTVPALGSIDGYDPDSRFFLKIQKDSRFSTNTPIKKTFRSTHDVNFADPLSRTIRVFSRDNITGVPTMYVVSKSVNLISADVKTAQFTFGSAQKFTKIELPDDDTISIVSVRDSDGNEWTQVDYLGQDLVLDERDITIRGNEGTFVSGSLQLGSTPPTKLAVYRTKPRRFVTRVNTNMKMELWFGSGTGNVNDELVYLNTTQIANDKYDQVVSNTPIDPSDFLASDSFGLAPANTTLTITYLVGGGIESNVSSGTITNVDFINVTNQASDYNTTEQALLAQTINSVAIKNEEPATGGGDVETIEEIRQNALAYFNAQSRVVTDKDYIVRTLAMPSQFGSVAKAFVLRDEQISTLTRQNEADLIVNNDEDPYNNRSYVVNPIMPNAINLYLLGYNSDKKLTTLNSTVKANVARYLEQFRMLTDDVNILDAFVVNVAVEFDIVVYKNYNINDVLARSIDVVKEYFDIDRWQINQPIVLSDLRLAIAGVDGVQSLSKLVVKNKYLFKDGRDYQEYRYPISEATVNDIIYPSLDPCIFELRYPDTDIIGNARQ